MSFSDLANSQMCTYLFTNDEFQDVQIGIRVDDVLKPIYSLKQYSLISGYQLTGEPIKRYCTFISAEEILSLDVNDYPEIFL